MEADMNPIDRISRTDIEVISTALQDRGSYEQRVAIVMLEAVRLKLEQAIAREGYDFTMTATGVLAYLLETQQRLMEGP